MNAILVGLNHDTTPVALRGKTAISADRLDDALRLFREYVSHGAILSTCNRTELYFVSNAVGDEPGVEFLKAWSNLPEAVLRRHVYTCRNEETFEHLFRVASGLESMIIGEYEVLGQVRHALKAAEKADMVNLPLRNLFHRAIGAGRKVREQTGISRNALSISSVAVTLVQRVVNDLEKCRVLVIGAGEAGRLAAKAALDRGASHVVVYNRSRKRAQQVVRELGTATIASGSLIEELRTSDIVISCTSAPHPVLRASTVREVMDARPGQPLVIIDISVPCDAEPEIGEIDGVFLHNIDDLIEFCDINRSQRENEVQMAADILRAELDKFREWWRDLEIRPVIGALMTKAEKVRRAQLALTMKKLPKLTDEERYSLEAMTRAVIAEVLKDPIKYLKERSGNNSDHVSLVEEVFHLEHDESR